MKSVILTNPLLISLFAVALVLLILDIIFKKVQWAFKVGAALLTVGGVITSLLFGATYQEVLIAVMTLVIVLFFGMYTKKKGEKDGV